MWMKSKENTKYWLEKIREETISIAHIESAQYVQDVVRTEMKQIKVMENSQNKETDSQSEELLKNCLIIMTIKMKSMKPRKMKVPKQSLGFWRMALILQTCSLNIVNMSSSLLNLKVIFRLRAMCKSWLL